MTFEEEVEDAFGTSDLEATGTSEVDIETNLASMFSHSVFMIFSWGFPANCTRTKFDSVIDQVDNTNMTTVYLLTHCNHHDQ